MRCESCGTELNDDMKFCGSCGAATETTLSPEEETSGFDSEAPIASSDLVDEEEGLNDEFEDTAALDDLFDEEEEELELVGIEPLSEYSEEEEEQDLLGRKLENPAIISAVPPLKRKSKVKRVAAEKSKPENFQTEKMDLEPPKPENTKVEQPVFETPKPETPKPEAPKQKEAKENNRLRNTLIISSIIVIGVLAAVVIGVMAYNQQLEEQAAYELQTFEEAHELHSVSIQVNAPNYDTAKDSKIPLLVEGIDLDGKRVLETFYIDSNGKGLSLMQGQYELTVIASPLLSSNTLYALPEKPSLLTVGKGGAMAKTPKISFTLLPVEEVTDEQLEEAAEYAEKSGMSESSITALKQGILNNRQQVFGELAALKAAEEEAAKIEEMKAEQKARYHYTTAYYEVDIPEYWQGRVRVVVQGNDIQVYDQTYDKIPLVSLSAVDSNTTVGAGDVATSLAFYQDNGKGKAVLMTTSNPPYQVWDYNQKLAANAKTAEEAKNTYGYTPEQEASLIDLSTFGTVKRDTIVAEKRPPGNYKESGVNKSVEAIVASIKVK